MDRLSDYDFILPPDRIAQEPLADRAASRLLTLNKRTGEVQHRLFRECASLLHKGDVLVVNRTRVTALRLLGHRLNPRQQPKTADHPRNKVAVSGPFDAGSEEVGGSIELLLTRRVGEGLYEALTKPAKRLQIGTRVAFGPQQELIATVTTLGEDGKRIVRLEPEALIDSLAQAPLPPYIRKSLSDRERYQTVYAKADAEAGSAAAPTAGLHFTQEILGEIEAKGVLIAQVELSIGIDTFRPVQVEDLADHQMHGEWCHLPPDAAEIINQCKGRVVAVGTTTARTLESFARKDSAEARTSVGRRILQPGTMISKLFLRPGNPFELVDALFTNFHMPRTSMLMMLSALAGKDAVLNAYAEALKEGYRFLSFGDSMFIGDQSSDFKGHK